MKKNGNVEFDREYYLDKFKVLVDILRDVKAKEMFEEWSAKYVVKTQLVS